jgi:hypothetical protein
MAFTHAMKLHPFLCFLTFGSLLLPAQIRSQESSIDFDKARTIFERRKRGEAVTADEEAYVKRAMAEKRKRQEAPASSRPAWSEHLTPLTELGEAKYKGEDGGLYGGGMNTPPESHLATAMRESAQIQPLDAEGKPSSDGKIGLISVGMSNTTMEYSKFKQIADADPAKSPNVIVIDAAQGGQTAMRWADTKSPLWTKVDERMKAAGLSDKQIQVAWMKQAEARPEQYGEFPKHAKQLQENLLKSLVNLKEKFPNLRIVYLSSRIYGGYATTALNPEPFAYEEAFSMRWLIQDQIAGKPEMKALPLLLWGPYLWADGETPRIADGLIYSRSDLSPSDGTHPSDSARTKVADLLLNFLKTDETAKAWFVSKP